MRTRTTLAATVLLLVACTPRTAPPISAGKRVFDGPAVALAASAGRHPPGLAVRLRRGAGGGKGAPRVLARGRARGGRGARSRSPTASLRGRLLRVARRRLDRRPRTSGCGGNGTGELWCGGPGLSPGGCVTRVAVFAGGPAGAISLRGGRRGPRRGALREETGSRQDGRLRAGVHARAQTGSGGAYPAGGWGALPPALARRHGRPAWSWPGTRDLRLLLGSWLAAVARGMPGTEGDLVAIPVARGGTRPRRPGRPRGGALPVGRRGVPSPPARWRGSTRGSTRGGSPRPRPGLRRWSRATASPPRQSRPAGASWPSSAT